MRSHRYVSLRRLKIDSVWRLITVHPKIMKDYKYQIHYVQLKSCYDTTLCKINSW